MTRTHERVTEILGRIRSARELAGMTQTDLARAIGLAGASSYQPIEAGTNALSVQQLLDICAALNVSPTWALTGIQPEFDEAGVDALVRTLYQTTMELGDALWFTRRARENQETQ